MFEGGEKGKFLSYTDMINRPMLYLGCLGIVGWAFYVLLNALDVYGKETSSHINNYAAAAMFLLLCYATYSFQNCVEGGGEARICVAFFVMLMGLIVIVALFLANVMK